MREDNDANSNRVQMKKDFVTANQAKKCKNLPPADFENCLKAIRKKISELSEEDLDGQITDPDRLKRFSSQNWSLNACGIDEIGVWPKMGNGLPQGWCEGSVKETAAHVEKFLQKQERCSIHDTSKLSKSIEKIQGMARVSEILKKMPIVVLAGGLHKRARKTKWDIDDGSFRAVTLALKGEKRVKAWIGSLK